MPNFMTETTNNAKLCVIITNYVKLHLVRRSTVMPNYMALSARLSGVTQIFSHSHSDNSSVGGVMNKHATLD